jgi:hypothetical protein
VTFPPGTFAIRVEGAAGLYLNGYGIVIMTLSAGANALRSPARARWRLPPRTRQQRWEERPALPCGRWADRMCLDPTLDWTLSDGAARTLALVVSLAGGAGRSLVTLTCSIAKQLGRTARTIQYHWNALVAAGYITRATDRRSGLVTITVTDLVTLKPKKRCAGDGMSALLGDFQQPAS